MFNDIQKNSVLISFLGLFSTIISGDKLAKTAGLVTLGVGTTVLTVEQCSDENIKKIQDKFKITAKQNPKLKQYAENINITAQNSLAKNILGGEYFCKNIKLIKYEDTKESKKNKSSAHSHLATYLRTTAKPTIEYYKDKLETTASIAGIASFSAGGYALSRFATPLSHNPRLVIPMIINHAIIIGVTGELLLSSAVYYANNNPDKIINGLARVYGLCENTILNDIDSCITNNFQSIRELLIDNKNTTAARFIKQQPFKESTFIKNDKEKNKYAFIEFNKNYLQSHNSSLVVRNLANFFISKDLQLNNNNQQK